MSKKLKKVHDGWKGKSEEGEKREEVKTDQGQIIQAAVGYRKEFNFLCKSNGEPWRALGRRRCNQVPLYETCPSCFVWHIGSLNNLLCDYGLFTPSLSPVFWKMGKEDWWFGDVTKAIWLPPGQAQGALWFTQSPNHLKTQPSRSLDPISRMYLPLRSSLNIFCQPQQDLNVGSENIASLNKVPSGSNTAVILPSLFILATRRLCSKYSHRGEPTSPWESGERSRRDICLASASPLDHSPSVRSD